jgi:hypothetical protein
MVVGSRLSTTNSVGWDQHPAGVAADERENTGSIFGSGEIGRPGGNKARRPLVSRVAGVSTARWISGRRAGTPGAAIGTMSDS